jgi:cytoskeletal protein CcmA (bactofilin family)/predicted RNA-binding Zn-ribbon protein involved in translation (DUF1610 family)
MKFRCPTCGSKDLWQPHKKTSFDVMIEKRGYGRYDCRNCWKRSIFRVDKTRRRRSASSLVQPEKATEPTATEPTPIEPTRAEPIATKPSPIARPAESTIIGATVLINGVVSSGEEMTIRGVLEGILVINDCRLVIEPGGHVAAEVNAGSVTVCRDGTLTGQVRTPSFVLEDGAHFNGNIELTAH